MARGDHDPSLSSEPALTGRGQSGDPVAAEPVLGKTGPLERGEERALHNVWDEPASMYHRATAATDAYSYSTWYQEGLASTSAAKSWQTVLMLCGVSGLFALIGASFAGPGETIVSIFSFVVFGPTVEELLKIGVPLMVLERRPYLFQSTKQFVVIAIVSALIFATVENVLYLYVALEDPSSFLILWRWTICTFVHLCASGIACLGVIRIYQRSRETYSKPRVAEGYRFFVAAIVFHGAYNFLAFTLEAGFAIFSS